MPIEILCDACQSKLRVADEHAGKMARCPRCHSINAVPQGGPSAPAETQRPQPEGRAEPTLQESMNWRLRTEDGEVYGPVGFEELSQWVAEGRVSAECQLQPTAGAYWDPASAYFPDLQSRPLDSSPESTFPRHAGPRHASSARPRGVPSVQGGQRGGWLLVGAILSLILAPGLGPVVWLLAGKDLREMRDGRRRRGDETTTRAAWVLAVIATVRLVVWFVQRL
jgi:hypothetical protein